MTMTTICKRTNTKKIADQTDQDFTADWPWVSMVAITRRKK